MCVRVGGYLQHHKGQLRGADRTAEVEVVVLDLQAGEAVEPRSVEGGEERRKLQGREELGILDVRPAELHSTAGNIACICIRCQ